MDDGRPRKGAAMTTTGKLAIAVLIGGLGAGLGGAVGCGGVSGSDVQSARQQATTASCNYYMMCNEIGPDAGTNGFENASTCQTMVLSFWTGQWPDSTCQGKVDQSALSVCIDAINSTLCMNGLDVLATLYAKCPVARVCPSGTGVDAGG
jgi:hypothetical protein